MGFRDKKDLAQAAARRTGRLPHQVKVSDDGTLTARELGGGETDLGTWTKTWGGKSQPSYHANPAR